MQPAEVLRLIDRGANFYCRQLGNASHMEFERRAHYAMIRPKPGEQGATSVFDVLLENLSDAEAAAVIGEIKALNVHTWWGLCVSDRIHRLIFGMPLPRLSKEEHENDEEVYMALFTEEKPVYRQGTGGDFTLTRVASGGEFALWADVCNSALHDNYPVIHRVNHYEICRAGILTCYLAYHHGQPAGTAAILNDDGMASLEFVATLPPYRRLGIARSACQRAADEAFLAGAKVITTRAFKAAKHIYQALGFKAYY